MHGNDVFDRKIYDYHGKEKIPDDWIEKACPKMRFSQTDLAARMQGETIIIERDSISRIESGTRFVPDYKLPIFVCVMSAFIEEKSASAGQRYSKRGK